jgi:hypothetical protein
MKSDVKHGRLVFGCVMFCPKDGPEPVEGLRNSRGLARYPGPDAAGREFGRLNLPGSEPPVNGRLPIAFKEGPANGWAMYRMWNEAGNAVEVLS